MRDARQTCELTHTLHTPIAPLSYAVSKDLNRNGKVGRFVSLRVTLVFLSEAGAGRLRWSASGEDWR